MPFQPGVSANPGGRPKAPTEAKLIARLLTPDAFRALKAALKRPGERVSAATVILAYAHGKPATNVNMRVIKSIEDLSEEELRVIAGEAEEQLALPSPDDDSQPDDEDEGE
jgi:hypothetical protein